MSKIDHAPHYCAMDHAPIRHWDSDESCPLCKMQNDRDSLLDALEYASTIINGLFRGELPACFKPSVEVVNVINRALHEAQK